MYENQRVTKRSAEYTMRPKTQMLNRELAVPGPGTYEQKNVISSEVAIYRTANRKTMAGRYPHPIYSLSVKSVFIFLVLCALCPVLCALCSVLCALAGLTHDTQDILT